MYRVAIRADGNANVGMGHIMRCLSLAKEFENEGCTVSFISKYDEGINKIKDNGIEAKKLGNAESSTVSGFYIGDIAELEKEVTDLIHLIVESSIDILVIDSYNISENYFLRIKPHVKRLVYIDDINKFSYPVDVLINGNITGMYIDYKPFFSDEIMLLGPEFNLVREEFKGLPARVINDKVQEIMITTGGADHYDMSPKLLDMFLRSEAFKSVKINVVVGDLFKNVSLLDDISKRHSNVTLHRNIKKISEIMLKSDLAISSGGSTLYELSACGTPTLAFILADNQKFIVEKLEELGYIVSLGWYDKFSIEKWTNKTNELYSDFSKRQKLSQNMRRLVDCKGAKRIVSKILQSFINIS